MTLPQVHLYMRYTPHHRFMRQYGALRSSYLKEVELNAQSKKPQRMRGFIDWLPPTHKPMMAGREEGTAKYSRLLVGAVRLAVKHKVMPTDALSALGYSELTRSGF